MASTLNASTSSGLISSGDTSGVLQLQTANTTALTVDGSQNVGIGTTSPTHRLDLLKASGSGDVGTWALNGGATGYLYAGGSVVGVYDTASGGGNGVILGGTSVAVRFQGGGNEYGRFDSSGNLLVNGAGANGKVSIATSTTQVGLSINCSNSSAFPIEAQVTASSYTGPGVRSRITNNASGTGYQAFTYYNDSSGDYLFKVLGNGNCQNANNSYGATSDIKLKENIVDATPKLADLCKVKVRQYNFKVDPTHKQIGVIAQELEEVFAGMVEESTDRDADGNDLGTTTKGVKYSVFVPMLVKAIQELKAINDTQAETINALTARIVALEQK